MKARDYAVLKHGNQKYGKFPYVYHLDQVVQCLTYYGYTDKDYIKAGYLHDVLEDTDTSLFEIADEFGLVASQLVFAVTAKGDNRAEKTAYTIKNLNLYHMAVPLKMADRLCNMRFSAKEGRKHIITYSQELPLYESLFMKFNPIMYGEMKHLCVSG